MSRSHRYLLAFPAMESVSGLRTEADLDLDRTAGYLVVDCDGHLIGRVERAVSLSARALFPDALSVRRTFLGGRRRLVPQALIEEVDRSSGVIGLRVDRETIRQIPETIARVRLHLDELRNTPAGA